MINLIPNDHREQIQYGRKNAKVLVWLSTVAFGAIVLLVVALVGRLTIQTAKNQTLSQKTAIEEQITASNLGEIEKDYNAFVTGVGSVKKVYQQQILYSRLIRKLATLLPSGARLTSISLTDKDRAINLNFDNDKDGLGPTIQVNLLNQGAQIAEQNRILTETGYFINLGGRLETRSDGSQVPEMKVDSSKKTVEYYISVVDDPEVKDNKLDTYVAALNNGGEYAFGLVKQSLFRDGYHYWLEFGKDDGSKIAKGETLPQMTSYRVDETTKAIDFTIRADSISQARLYEQALNNASNSMFIETYLFEDTDYTLKNKCTDKSTGDITCKAVCPDEASECSVSEKSCSATATKGCQYIVRAYYDELFTTAKVDKLDDKTAEEACPLKEGYRVCTHRITATYEPLFEKVDINRITLCSIEQSTNKQSCVVEMRAEFGANAKFYLVNSGSGS